MTAVCERIVAEDDGVRVAEAEGLNGVEMDIDDRGVRVPEDGVKTPEVRPWRFFLGLRRA